MFVRLDDLLSQSGLEGEFFTLSVAHRKIDLSAHSAAEIQSLSRNCTLALRSNLARLLTGLNHRDFCIRLADSSLLQWFLQVGRVDGVSTFAKSTSDRFAHFIDAPSLQKLNVKLIGLLQEDAQCDFSLKNAPRFDAVYFDSTCLKAPIHHPVDWVLLRDATRTLMKAVERIRKEGLVARMPKAPLLFLSEMNTLCMAMAAKHRTGEGRKHRKKVLREMKALLRRISQHAQRHLNRLKELGETTDLGPGRIQRIITEMENVLAQVPAIIKQAHERIIGGRKLANKDKILSLYDGDVQVIKRGKSNGEVEYGNNLAMQCRACHTFEDGAGALGPSLYGLFGRPAGSVDGYPYSPVLTDADFYWTPRALDAFLAQPFRFLPGNSMAYAGLRHQDDRDALVAALLRLTAPTGEADEG